MNREKLIYIQPCVKRVVMVPELATAKLGQGSYETDGSQDDFGGQIIEGDLPEGQELDVKKNNLWDEVW